MCARHLTSGRIYLLDFWLWTETEFAACNADWHDQHDQFLHVSFGEGLCVQVCVLEADM